jgi:hypothetical protein
MGLFWIIFMISIITRIINAVKKAAGVQGKGFDADTVRKRLEELRRVMEGQAQGQSTVNRPQTAVPQQIALAPSPKPVANQGDDYGSQQSSTSFKGSQKIEV